MVGVAFFPDNKRKKTPLQCGTTGQHGNFYCECSCFRTTATHKNVRLTGYAEDTPSKPCVG